MSVYVYTVDLYRYSFIVIIYWTAHGSMLVNNLFNLKSRIFSVFRLFQTWLTHNFYIEFKNVVAQWNSVSVCHLFSGTTVCFGRLLFYILYGELEIALECMFLLMHILCQSLLFLKMFLCFWE